MAHYLSELRNFRLYPDRDSGKLFRVAPADHKDLPPSTIAFPKQTVPKNRLQPFYYDLRPVIFVLQFAGVIPVTRSPDTGLWNHGFLSPLMLYTVALYTTILVILWFTTGAKLQDLLATHRHFNVLFFVCMAVSYFLVVLCLPVMNWPEAPNIARYLSSWTRFQEKYYDMLGRPLILSLRRRSILLCLILSPLIFSFEVIYQVNNEDGVLIDWWVTVKEWYLDVVRFFLASFWHLICASLARAARDLLDNFHREVESEKRITPITVATYRAVWVELSRLARETGRAFCYTMGFYILYLFLTLTFFVYHTVSNLAREVRMDQLLMALECVVMGSTLFVVCDSATKTTHQVGEEFRDSLLAARIAVTDTYIQEEMDLFLRTIDTFPPDVSLADFVTVNRALFMSLGSMLTTYLIVLLQFNMSSEDNRGYNITLQI